jgi:8-oxo-dGTP diphosphatase
MPNRPSRHNLAISSPVLVQLPERAVRLAPSTPFRISVKAIVAYHDQVLLLRKVEGKWDLPGGRLDGEEDPIQGLERELLEEIGVTADASVLVDCAVRRRVTNMPILVVFYLCRTRVPVEKLRLSAEHNVARLFAPAEVETLKLYRCYKDAIVKVMADHHRRGR